MTQIDEPQQNRDSLYAEFRRLSPRVTGGILRAREASFEDGVVTGTQKLLTALAISVALRCEPCIKQYVALSVQRGATKEEFIEVLNVAMTMQGCPGEEWALKAYEYYKAFTSGQPPVVDDSCCST